MQMVRFAVLAIALAFATSALTAANAGRAERRHLRSCILRATTDFPKFRALVEDVRSFQITWLSDGFEERYAPVLAELKMDLRNSIHAVFTVQQNSLSPQMNNFPIDRLLRRLIDDLLIKPQREAASAAYESLSKEEKEKIDSQWAGRETGGIISSAPRWMAEIAQEMKKSPGKKEFVDVGSGHGIPSLLLGQEFPETNFIGLDFVQAKVIAANAMARNMELDNVHFRHQDLMQPGYRLPEADYYYFFNPAYPKVLEHVAKQIADYSKHRDIKIFSAEGGGSWVAETFEKYGCTGEPLAVQRVIQIITCK